VAKAAALKSEYGSGPNFGPKLLNTGQHAPVRDALAIAESADKT